MEAWVADFLRYSVDVLAITLNQSFILVGPGLILTMAMHLLSLFVERQAYALLGRNLFLALFGWLGTSIHELGHAFFHLVFGHRLLEIALFKPDPTTNTLGYTRCRYNADNVYHRIGMFFVGVGPVLFGSTIIYLAARWLIGPQVFASMQTLTINETDFRSLFQIKELLGEVYRASRPVVAAYFNIENLARWQFYLFVYLTFSVGSSITLSPQDIRGASSGFFTLAILLMVSNTLTLWMGPFMMELAVKLSRLYATFYAVMIFVILTNLIVAAVFIPLGAFLNALRRKVPYV